MKESILLISNIHKGGIEAGDELLYLAQVKVSNGKAGVRLFRMQLHQLFVFEQGYINALCGRIDDKFFVHITTALLYAYGNANCLLVPYCCSNFFANCSGAN